MIDIALVSYINTRPFLDGFDQHISPKEAQFHLLPPADCAQALQEKRVQMALIPVGSLVDFESLSIMPNYCIGADGAVESVFLFAQSPIQELKSVILDRHSRTSNGLTRVLMRWYWQQKVEFLEANEKHFDQIQGDVGGVVIGDKAIEIRDQYAYVYDLAEEWRKMTGLPFVFAVWAYETHFVSPFFLDKMRKAMKEGIRNAAESAKKWADEFGMTEEFAHHYLTQAIDFRFDSPKHRAMRLYFKLLQDLDA